MNASGVSKPVDADVAPAVDGRVPGWRGQATRARLLEATRLMLDRGTYRDVKVVDIAREAGTSPATFYQYFPDVEAAVAVLAEEMATDGAQRLGGLVRSQDWRPSRAEQSARAVVSAFFAFWDEHRPLMRVMDLTAAEGDQRIRAVRVRLMHDFATALALVVADAIDAGRVPAGTDPMAVASVAVTLLVNVSIQRDQFNDFGIDSAAIDDTVVRMVYSALSGRDRARRPVSR